MSQNQNLFVNDNSQSINNENRPCTNITGRSSCDQIDKVLDAANSNRSIVQTVSHNLMANNCYGNVRSYESTPCMDATESNNPEIIDLDSENSNESIVQVVSNNLVTNDFDENVNCESIPCTNVIESNNFCQIDINPDIVIKSIAPTVPQSLVNHINIKKNMGSCINTAVSTSLHQIDPVNSDESALQRVSSHDLIVNNCDVNVKKEKDSCMNTSRINNLDQINAVNNNESIVQPILPFDSTLNNFGLNIKKERISSTVNVMETNISESVDQRDTLNSNDLLADVHISSHNSMMDSCRLNIKKEQYEHSSVNGMNSSDQIDASDRDNLIVQSTSHTNTINNIRVKKDPEDNHDRECIIRETKYFSIKKLPGTKNVSSMTINHCEQASNSNSNIIYTCNICKTSLPVDLHSFALHMSSHIECSLHECIVCDKTFMSVLLWRNHMIYHQQQVDLNLPNSQNKSNEIEFNSSVTSNSPSVEPQNFSETLDNGENNFSSSDTSSVNDCSKKNRKLFCCNICTNTFPSRLILMAHQTLHRKSKPICCKFCNRTFSSRGPCTNHEKSHTSNENVNVVEEIEHQPSEFQNNQIKNNNKNPISIICKKKKKQILTTNNRFVCTVCQKRFIKLCYLTNHMILQHKIKPVKSVEHLAKSSNRNNGIGNINGEKSSIKCKKRKLSTELNPNSSVVDGNFNNFDGQIVENIISCKICNKQFTHLGALSNHMKMHSNCKPYNCQYCGRHFNMKGPYTNHIKSHNLNTKVQNCNNKNLNIVKLERNVEHQQEENFNNSERVNCSFTDKTNIIKKNRLWFPCDACVKKFSTPFQLILHRRSHCDIEPYLCKICNKSYTVRHRWNRHIKSHYLKYKFKSKGNKKNNTLKVDTVELKIEPVQHQNLFKCGYCKKEYSLIPRWKQHLSLSKECRRHCKNGLPEFKSIQARDLYTKSTRFECHICRNTYSTSFNRKVHLINVHKQTNVLDLNISTTTNVNEQKKKLKTDTIPQKSKTVARKKSSSISNNNSNQCQICGKIYSNKANLTRHQTISHNVETTVINCTICNRTFKHKYSFREHLKSKHNQHKINIRAMSSKKKKSPTKPMMKCNIKRYFCKICKMEFADNATLKKHAQTHTLSKYECIDCGQLFATNIILGEHILNNHSVNTTPNDNSHVENDMSKTNSQPIQCKICSKVLKTASYLSVHMRVHSGVKPFKCDKCNMAFRFKPNLRIHKRKHYLESITS